MPFVRCAGPPGVEAMPDAMPDAELLAVGELLPLSPVSAAFTLLPLALQPTAARTAATATTPDRNGSAWGRNLSRMSLFMMRPLRLALVRQAPRPRPPVAVRVLPSPRLIRRAPETACSYDPVSS